jgi:hypothetical protein
MARAVRALFTSDLRIVRRVDSLRANAQVVSTFFLLFYIVLAQTFVLRQKRSYIPQEEASAGGRGTPSSCSIMVKDLSKHHEDDDDKNNNNNNNTECPFTVTSRGHRQITKT